MRDGIHWGLLDGSTFFCVEIGSILVVAYVLKEVIKLSKTRALTCLPHH
jgi:hypothetical protein